MSKWEYFFIVHPVVMYDPSSIDKLTDDIDRYGADGWELVAVTYLDSNVLIQYTFKRQLPE